MQKLKNIAPAQGRLLLSEPFMQDENFRRAVILLAGHDEKGSFGFILNKPIDLDLHKSLDDFPVYDGTAYLGGPVNKNQLFYIHTLGPKLEESIHITGNFYWGGNFEILKDMIRSGKVSEQEVRFFVGYAGWDPKQLNKELKERSWIVAESKPEFILPETTTTLWSDVLKSMGQEFAIMANFPEDPSLN